MWDAHQLVVTSAAATPATVEGAAVYAALNQAVPAAQPLSYSKRDVVHCHQTGTSSRSTSAGQHSPNRLCLGHVRHSDMEAC
jgi:hypothetical protein